MKPHHSVLSLRTIGSTFFGDTVFEFADGLNAFMAGRGCGKTAVLYLLRFALGSAIPKSYAKELDGHVRAVLGPGTVVATVKTQHGMVYSSSRAYGEAPKVRNAAGEIVDVSLDGEIFRLDAYAAKEIEAMAEDPAAQLELVDRFEPAETRKLSKEIAANTAAVATSGAEVDRLTLAIAADEAHEAELPEVIEALKGMTLGDATSGDELLAAEARRPLRGSERNAMTAIDDAFGNVERALDAFARDAAHRLGVASGAELERAPAPHGPILSPRS